MTTQKNIFLKYRGFVHDKVYKRTYFIHQIWLSCAIFGVDL